MRKQFIPLFILAALLSSCFPGAMSFDYYWNPYNLLALSAKALKHNNLPLWNQTLSDHALCTLGNKRGMNTIQNLLGSDPQKKYTLGDLRLIQGNPHQGEHRYQANVIDRNESKIRFSLVFKCNVTTEQSFCSISKVLGEISIPAKTLAACADLE